MIHLVEYKRSDNPVQLPVEVAGTISTHLNKYLEIVPAWNLPGYYWLTAKQFIGDIMVGEYHINIRSEKASWINLFWMLTYAYDLPQFRDQVRSYESQNNLFEFLVLIFVRQVEQLVRQGIVRNYRTHQGNQPRIRGRLLMAQQLRHNLVHPERFAVRWAEHTPDVLENQLLKHVLLRLASIQYPAQQELNHRLRKSYAAFDLVSYRLISHRDFEELVYTQLNQHYRGPLALARLLWQQLGLRNEGGQAPFATYLFDLNLLFEQFIAAYLRQTLSSTSLQVKGQYALKLDRDHLEDASIDIVLLRGRQPVLALDTKYKTYTGKPTRPDLNQIFVYCQTLGLKRGVLLYPDRTLFKDRRLLTGVTLDLLGIPLGGSLDHFQQNLKALTNTLIEVIKEQG